MNDIEIAIIVNGAPTMLHAKHGTHLHELVAEALKQSNNLGQGAENWELRDAAGVELDQSKTVGHYHLESGVKLFLNLRAGVGG